MFLWPVIAVVRMEFLGCFEKTTSTGGKPKSGLLQLVEFKWFALCDVDVATLVAS